MIFEKRVVGYLSAAPRVSTRIDAEATGPRAHVLGVMTGFNDLGWDVKPFIVGNQVPLRWSSQGSESELRKGRLRTFAADLIRLTMGPINARRAWKEIGGQVSLVYERFAVLQSLGNIFRQHNIPWILETNALYFQEAANERDSLMLTGLARRLEINAYQKCDVLICVSQVLKNIIAQEAQISPDKIIVVPNGVDTIFFDPDKFSPKFTDDEITIGYVGHLYPWQGLDILLHAMSEIRCEDGITFQLCIVGDGPIRTELDQLVKKLNLSPHVRFLGLVPWEDVPGHIVKFDIGYSNKVLNNTTKMYFSPLKIYEYMAMAKPVLCSDEKGAPRVIQHQKTGFTFPATDIKYLRNVLRQIYESRGRLPMMGKQARQEAVTHHSWGNRVSFIS